MNIALTDIIKTINSRLEVKFPKVNIESTDITEGFNRPSFFVNIDNHSKSNLCEVLKDVNLTVRIYYFPSSKTKNRVELITMVDELNDLFLTNLKINEDFYIPIDEVNSNITEERVLVVDFDIRYVFEIPEDEDLMMIDDLEIEIKKG